MRRWRGRGIRDWYRLAKRWFNYRMRALVLIVRIFVLQKQCVQAGSEQIKGRTTARLPA